jgi:PelA/Pel-15E family pectate lyase
MKKHTRSLILVGLFNVSCGLPAALAGVSWGDVLRQPSAWYASDEALVVAKAVLSYQTDSGGWPKNHDMTSPRRSAVAEGEDVIAPTIDNGATYTQIEFLARVNQARENADARAAVIHGIDYLLAAQYDNGGWPQFFPLRHGYYTHITFNDDAMVGVLKILREVSAGRAPYLFIDRDHQAAAGRAVEKGVDCILRCQVVVDGVKTVWCAQHDEHTLAPAQARKYELVSLSGYESVGIVRFLMSLDQPSPAIREAIRSAVAWFERVKLTGLREERVPDSKLPRGYDVRVVEDNKAPPLWARFYEIGTNRPMFCGRDSVGHYVLAEIEPERRTGYHWYTEAPRLLLTVDFPRWTEKWSGSDRRR